MDNTHYFYRSVVFTLENNKVALVDINQTDNVTPLDEWMGLVVSHADGLHTIQEFIDYISKKYKDVPENIEKTVHSVMERLTAGDIIRLSEKSTTLPYYLASPIEKLDIEKAKKLIQEDEIQKH